MKKERAITIIIIIAVILLAYYIINKDTNNLDEELAKCIGQNSVLYVQPGCSHCENQKRLFGDNIKHINQFLCNQDNWKTCSDLGITATPTWRIKDKNYRGTHSIETLKKLTGC